MSDFATRIRTRREEIGLTQAQLASKVGVTRLSISNYERGIHVPIPAFRRALANALDVPLEWLHPTPKNNR